MVQMRNVECEIVQMRSPVFGLEEEVFITEPERPTLASLYYLSRLLWRNPKHYYRYSASNFARGRDARQCLMSGIEIATAPRSGMGALLSELRQRRADLLWAVGDRYVVPIGNLFDLDCPTNTCGLHIHLSVPEAEKFRVYQNIGYFLPLLMLMSASSPYSKNCYQGPSYRMASSYAIGALRDDPTYRFQDLIFARRLGTIEVRILDPVWDWGRLRWILQAIQTIAMLPFALPLDLGRYADLREQACRKGYTPDLRALYQQLGEYIPLPEALLERTASDEIVEWYEQYGRASTYRALDYAYRHGSMREVPPRPMRGTLIKGLAGLVGYYSIRLPYTLYKAWREWH
jgi:hypothetical protein